MKRITAAHFTVFDLLRQMQSYVPAYRSNPECESRQIESTPGSADNRSPDLSPGLGDTIEPSNDTADFLNNHRLASVRIVVGARESEPILAKFMKDSV